MSMAIHDADTHFLTLHEHARTSFRRVVEMPAKVRDAAAAGRARRCWPGAVRRADIFSAQLAPCRALMAHH